MQTQVSYLSLSPFPSLSKPNNRNKNKPFLCSCFSSLSSLTHSPSSISTPTSNPSLSNFLIKTLAISEPQAVSISNRFSSRKSLEKPHSVVQFLKQLGFSDDHIRSSVRSRPQILFSDVDKTLKPKLHFFLDLGLTGPELGMLECKPSPSPTSSKSAIFVPDPEFSDTRWFRRVVGSLQYLTLTKPEIAYAVNLACQHMHSPKYSHFVAVKHILRYIQGTLHQGLIFTPSPLQLSAFSDADWAGNSLDRRSTSGYCLFLGSNLVSWCAKKQPTVA